MIPYFQWISFHIGPVPIQLWGLMVAIGIVLGLWVAVRAAVRRKLNSQVMIDIAFWSILSALIGARIFFVLSEAAVFIAHPLDVFKIWEGGMSISGGFIGAVAGAWIFTKIKKVSFLEYADAAALGLPIGLWIGRLGCFFIFDHPGSPTSFFLGETYLDGVVRHNHGLYLSINGLLMALIFGLLWKKNPHRRTGFFSMLFLLWYGVVRFVLDFFRAWDGVHPDTRFAGLTWAQYAALFMVVLGGILWYTLNRKSSDSPKR